MSPRTSQPATVHTATVNRATFYHHFPDTYAVLDEMIRAGLQPCFKGVL